MSDGMDGASFVVDQPEGRFYAEVVYVNDVGVSGGTLCGLAMSWEAERIAAAMNLCRGVDTDVLLALVGLETHWLKNELLEREILTDDNNE